ncbi:NACHT domain-containing protein [Streptomyces sp. CB03234]|uniref:NACHT domain-containing protein n=1 Tax=Streptomyces sp. (strain CB03234) TaxID=1703937 RepID=UPI0018E9BF02|nr:NACHT domain-containing protein [Streptomyces sp. CB03234]
MELLVTRLAGTVLSTVARSILAPRAGAGLVDRPVRPLRRPPKPDRLAKVLSRRLAEAYASLPEYERLAAVGAVQDSFATAGEIDAERLFALDLDPSRLCAELRSPAAVRGLSARALDLYEELLALCCAHVVEQFTTHPTFPARAAVEQTRTAGRTQALVEGLAAGSRRPVAAALEFEQRYADYVAATHGRLELFGLTLGRSASEWPLDTAYISLAVSGEGVHHDRFSPPGTGQVAVKAEQALAETDRILLRGPAGSGKSTMVQWLALNAARRRFDRDLDDWNRCVPFVLRLRAFTSSGSLPGPGDFLRAAGVPLHGAAPAGWVENLMTDGRALILVDGVDEVPPRLRKRTQDWLKGLIAAFPHARYVVTTRPSAVPEDWLAPCGFATHSLLPMERDDIRAFIEHWHDAARHECGAEPERARLNTYETSLLQAVGTRRALGRLVTNPLMCALLCALNRDRRMQLPRARKELYDAALDMLLVRRDTEREVVGVEGVDLTREEQMALLQRFAYWLIRNGQTEADRADAVAMVEQWLGAMPQVEGTSEQVFSHLLIRSGLLREPRPGAVDFVHRTFQDYLGAKAAVESRDFGVLVRHAHDDQWDDVVQMAVGHARVDERARLLTDLLQRADDEPCHRHRLVLLAAACLEHAPELDPEVRATVQQRTQELLPPRSQGDAEELAKVGELVLELLPGPEEGLDEYSAAAVVRTAALIKGDAAFQVVARFREDTRPPVPFHLSQAWGSFDTEAYLREVLAARVWEEDYLHVKTVEQFEALGRVPKVHAVHIEGDHSDLRPLLAVDNLHRLFLYENGTLSDLSTLRHFRGLKDVGLSRCSSVRDLAPLTGPALERLSLFEVHPGASLEPLREMTSLTFLHLAHWVLVESVAELPVGHQLTGLSLQRQARYVSLEGIERWPSLTSLALSGATQLRQLSQSPARSRLTSLTLNELAPFDLELLGECSQLEMLFLWRCELPSDLAPLRDLPALTRLSLWQCESGGSPIDLSPFAGREELTITLSDDMPFTGGELLDPSRIVVRRTQL